MTGEPSGFGLRTRLRFRDAGLDRRVAGYVSAMIVVGIVLLLLGLILGVPLLWTLGIIVLVVGLVLMLLGSTGRAVGGRRHYW
jgi:hypothetical protein